MCSTLILLIEMHYISLHFCQMQFIGGFSPSLVEKVTQRKTVILYFSVQINSSLLVFMFINNCRILWGRGTVKRNEMRVTNLKGKENLGKTKYNFIPDSYFTSEWIASTQVLLQQSAAMSGRWLLWNAYIFLWQMHCELLLIETPQDQYCRAPQCAILLLTSC